MAGVQCKTWAFRDELCQMLEVTHLQMATAMFAKTLDNLQESIQLIPKSRSFTQHAYVMNLGGGMMMIIFRPYISHPRG
jgi:hypothetical protein